MSSQLSLRGVAKSYGDHRVFDQVTFSVRPGERLGVVGENGSGKSTLLRLIVGIEPHDDGDIVLTAAGGVGHLDQVLTLSAGHTVQQAIDAALAELRAIEARMHELEADLEAETAGDRLTEYGDLLALFEARGGYEADARVDKALYGLGLAGITRERTLGSLSGGEQARLRLACLLAASPEIMLLDEPTNHLDLRATQWLEEALRAHRGTVLVISHDRIFLERVATSILEVDGGAITRYGGGYAGFLAEQAAARRRWELAYAEWKNEIRRLEEHAATTARQVAPGRPMRDRNKLAYARDAGRVQSSIAGRVRQTGERLRRLREDPVPEPPRPLRFTGRFHAAAPAAPAMPGTPAEPAEAAGAHPQHATLVELHDVRVDDRLAVESFGIGPGERLLVEGPNGAGKSTLLRVLAGELEPDDGVVRRQGVIGHLPQESVFDRPAQTVVQAFAAGRYGSPDDHRAVLRSLGLLPAAVFDIPVGALSAGQRRRLSLARLLTRATDLLLLDEPTNHLSLTLVEELEEALGLYPGAVVVVSHDRALRGRFHGERVGLRDGRLIRP